MPRAIEEQHNVAVLELHRVKETHEDLSAQNAELRQQLEQQADSHRFNE